MTVAPAHTPGARTHAPSARSVIREIEKHSYCILATADADGAPHAIGLLYSFVNGVMYLATGIDTKKARNAAANQSVSVCIPVRKFPVGPPFAVSFQGEAEILSKDDPEIGLLLAAGKLKKIVGYGVLDEPDLCFIRITPSRRVHTYGLGIPLRELLRCPAHADRTITLPRSAHPEESKE
jgi:general stress protein 26